MNKVILVALLLVTINAGNSQDTGYEKLFDEWDAKQLEKANTAKDIPYMTTEEKSVILLCNLARLDGEMFSKTFLNHYIEKNDMKETRYVRSLFRDLKKTMHLEPLFPKQDLYEIAKDHATKSGKKGTTGHEGFNSRYNKIKNTYKRFSENCDYGNDNALDIVMNLLIDEGISSLGHRKNILDANLKYIGVSIKQHKRYRNNCVMDFGG